MQPHLIPSTHAAMMVAMFSGFLAAGAAEPQAASRSPNVVLIVSDDQHVVGSLHHIAEGVMRATRGES